MPPLCPPVEPRPSTQETRTNPHLQSAAASTRSLSKKPAATFRISLASSTEAAILPSCSTWSRRFFPSLSLPRARTRGGLAARVVRGMLRRPSVAGSSTVTCCSVHIHNKVAKKRDAATSLFLYRLRAHTVRHDADFIVGDFNMSAFSTVGDVFTVPDFLQPLAMLTCGAVVVWSSLAKTALASSPCLSARTRGESRHSDVTFLDNADLGFAPSDVSAHFPVFLHLLERAAGKQDRKRLRKRLAQEFSPSVHPAPGWWKSYHTTANWYRSGEKPSEDPSNSTPHPCSLCRSSSPTLTCEERVATCGSL